MAGYGDSGDPARQQMPAGRDANAAAGGSQVQGVDKAAGVQIGSGNVQVTYFYSDPATADARTPPLTPEPGTPRARDIAGLGSLLFTARVSRHSGQLLVAFGAGDTLVVPPCHGCTRR